MRTILIVEDDPVLGGVLHAAFRREWTVELAQSARDALESFRESPPEVVLTDKNMPGMDGMELVRELRKLDPTVGIVVMTAYGTVDSARDSIDSGVDAYIEKPFPNLLELGRELDRLRHKVIERRRMARPAGGPVRLVIACNDLGRRDLMREWITGADRVGWCDNLEDLTRAIESGDCTASLIDCVSLEVDPEEVLESLHPEKVPCIVIAEGLAVPAIAKLIDQSVKALIDRPIDEARFGEQLHRAVERIRCGTA